MPRPGLLSRVAARTGRRCLAVLAALILVLALPPVVGSPGMGPGAVLAQTDTATERDATERDAAVGRSTGLPIPRFVSLRASEVNLRTGPGLRYPVDWVYRRNHLPVQVIDEFNAWRQIRDWEGTVGWVHTVMLQSKRTARVMGEEPLLLRVRGHRDAEPVALVPAGAVGDLDGCEGNWCRMSFDGGHHGWLPRNRLFGPDSLS